MSIELPESEDARRSNPTERVKLSSNNITFTKVVNDMEKYHESGIFSSEQSDKDICTLEKSKEVEKVWI